MEHRWGSRQPLKLPVDIETAPTGLTRAVLTDVSLTGGYLRCDARFQGSICVRLRLKNTNGSGAGHEWLEAHVARRTPHGLGLEWLEFSPQPIANLLRTCASKASAGAQSPLSAQQ